MVTRYGFNIDKTNKNLYMISVPQYISPESIMNALNTDTSLVIYYSFNNDTVSGQTVKNIATGTYDLTLSTANMISSSGKKNEAIYFNGVQTTYGTISALPALGNNSITVAYWIKITGNSVNSAIFGRNGTLMHQIASGQYITTFINNQWYYLTSGNFASNAWVHLAVVYKYNGASNNSTIYTYTNGVLTNTINNANYLTSSAQTNLLMGIVPGWGSLVGYIDEFRIYSRELTASEISSIYNY